MRADNVSKDSDKSVDSVPHIANGNLVRVLHGPHKLRQGLVTGKLGGGDFLSLFDTDLKENVSLHPGLYRVPLLIISQFFVASDHVQKLLIIQDTFRASKAPNRPWEEKLEPCGIDDFVQVLRGDHEGVEGFVKSVGSAIDEPMWIEPSGRMSHEPLEYVQSNPPFYPPPVSTVSSISCC